MFAFPGKCETNIVSADKLTEIDSILKSNVEKNEYSPSGYKINKILKVFKN